MELQSESKRQSKSDTAESNSNDLSFDTTRAAQIWKQVNDSIMDPIRQTVEIGPAVVNRIDRFNKERDTKPPVDRQSVDWLVVLNLSTQSFGEVSGDNNEKRLQNLKDLADKTKGKPVAIVAQMPFVDVDDFAYNGELLDRYSFLVPNPHHMDRYIVHDGKVTKIDTVNSGGYAHDVSNLLELACDHFKAGKKALIADSHGNGNLGLSGDIGKMTMDQFIEAAKKGVLRDENEKGKNKDKKPFDLIDFDACLMGQDDVMRLLKPITNHVVASAETEGGRGQDLITPIEKIIANPKMSGSELADTMVETARLQPVNKDVAKQKPPQNIYEWLNSVVNPWTDVDKKSEGEKSVTIETLAHYDLTHIDEFSGELDKLGEALTKAIEDPKNRKTLDRLIDNAPVYADYFFFASDKRDLKVFVETIMDSVSRGDLSDPDQKIRIHAGRLLDAHKKLVKSYSGFGDFGSNGGLTSYVPDRETLDFHIAARDKVSACGLRESVENPPADFATDRETYLQSLNDLVVQTKRNIEAEYVHVSQSTRDDAMVKWKDCDAALKKLEAAKDLESTFKALHEMRQAAAALESTKHFQTMVADEEKELKAEIDKEYKDELVNPDMGWGKFRTKLRHLD
ncbi:MAG: hypothetical protein K2W82_17695 [Candidatus Obscuribacterales bacterium]|nr:hypothetical protein [Candidatus Obscuribacterales bacterium]